MCEKNELSVPERNRWEYDTKRGKCKTDHNEMKPWCKRKLWQRVKQSRSVVWRSNGAEHYILSFPFRTKTKVQNNTQPCWVRAGEKQGKLEAIVYLETVSRSNFVCCTLTKTTALRKMIFIFLTLYDSWNCPKLWHLLLPLLSSKNYFFRVNIIFNPLRST